MSERGFEAYAVLCFVDPDDDLGGPRWRPDFSAALGSVIAANACPSTTCYASLFEMTDDISRLRALRLITRNRTCLVSESTLDDLRDLPVCRGHPSGFEPTMFWPADGSWFVASDFDDVVSFIGGSRGLIDAVLAEPHLRAEEIAEDEPFRQEWTD